MIMRVLYYSREAKICVNGCCQSVIIKINEVETGICRDVII